MNQSASTITADLAPEAQADGAELAHLTDAQLPTALRISRKLRNFVDAVGRFGPNSSPESFETEEDELAFYLNAYNALMFRKWLDGKAGSDEVATSHHRDHVSRSTILLRAQTDQGVGVGPRSMGSPASAWV